MCVTYHTCFDDTQSLYLSLSLAIVIVPVLCEYSCFVFHSFALACSAALWCCPLLLVLFCPAPAIADAASGTSQAVDAIIQSNLNNETLKESQNSPCKLSETESESESASDLSDSTESSHSTSLSAQYDDDDDYIKYRENMRKEALDENEATEQEDEYAENCIQKQDIELEESEGIDRKIFCLFL